jgi:site-specific DNA-methyltransferase (adenine-specific)
MALARMSLSSQARPAAELTLGHSTLRFYQGDCLDVLASLDAGSVGVVVTSPPYNLGIKYRSYRDDIPRTDYLNWMERWSRAVARVVVEHGSLFLNVGAKPTDPWIPLEVAQIVRNHFKLQNTIHWVKSIAIDREAAGETAGLDDDMAVGHYKPINSERFVNDCHEYIFHFTPGGRTPLDRRAVGVKYQDPSNIKRWAGAGGGRRCRGNTWFIPYETIQSRDRDRPHPASFPPRVPEQCLKLHGVERAGVVFDPFLGLGNSAIAAVALGLDFVGVELDANYLEEAVRRVKASVRPGAVNGASVESCTPAGRPVRRPSPVSPRF